MAFETGYVCGFTVHSFTYHETANMYFVVVWLSGGRGHMNVMCTVYKHSDITYLTILM